MPMPTCSNHGAFVMSSVSSSQSCLARRHSTGAASAAVLLIAAVDALSAHAEFSLPTKALLDESSHIATTLLFLGALWPSPVQPVVLGTVLGSVIIDIDHIPMTIEHHGDLNGLARPDSHSLLTVLLVAGLGRWLPVRRRPYALGLAFGIATHLTRDMATGRVRLFWPLAPHGVHLPYPIYGTALIIALAVILHHTRRDTRDHRLS
jgi:inner membrane protein